MNFLQRYATLFTQPDLRAAILASLVGRLPIGISGLALLLLVQAREGSFTDSGLVTSAYLGGLAGIAPLVGRLIDRLGPRPVLLVAGLAYPIALVTLVGALTHGAPLALVLALSFLAGATLPQVTTCMRTLYRHRLQDDALLIAALSLDSVLIEIVFIVGPMLVAFVVATSSPDVAVLLGALCAALGALFITRTPALTAWSVAPSERRTLLGALHDPAFRRLLTILVGYSAVFGLVDIGVASYAIAARQPALAGVILGVMSIGSAAGGLAYGSRSWHLPLARQFSLALIIMGVSIAPMALIANPSLLAFMALLSGLTMAPPLIIQSTMVAKTMPTSQMAEAFTWVTTAMLCGVGLGFAFGGAVVEARGAAAAFVLAAGITVLMGVAARSMLRTPT
ncbi:MAG: MFS transporter [bacterium]|jgi:MFS family permease